MKGLVQICFLFDSAYYDDLHFAEEGARAQEGGKRQNGELWSLSTHILCLCY